MSNPIKKTTGKTSPKSQSNKQSSTIKQTNAEKSTKRKVDNKPSTASKPKAPKGAVPTKAAKPDRKQTVSPSKPAKASNNRTNDLGKKTMPKYKASICEEMAPFKVADVIAVIAIDKSVLSTSKDFLKDNQNSYWLLLNTWMFQVKEISEYGYYDLKDHILRVGLVQTIRECCKLSDEIIIGYTFGEDSFFKSSQISCNYPAYLTTAVSGCEDMKQLLQILRFPKRFCPSGADLVRDRGISSFLDVNRNCREFNELMYGETAATIMSRRVRPYIYDMLKGIVVDEQEGRFGTGVAYDAKRPLASKLCAFAKSNPNFLDHNYPLLSFQGFSDVTDKQEYSCRLQAVPKSYKTPRIIAMEPSERQFHMQAIRLSIERTLERNGYTKFFDVHDQSGNRQRCFTGSVDGSYSTVDMSAASDSMARALVWRLFPKDVFNQMYAYLSKYVEVPSGECRLVHMFSTSGAALTFVVQGMVFLAIALYANDCFHTYTKIKPLPPKVFGDDCIIDSRVFVTFLDTLDRLGFTVNIEKSFDDSTKYRESCGVEYCYGFDTSTRYFPRNELKWGSKDVAETIGSLVALQHRLYDCNACRFFLTKYIRTLEPRMTSHTPGTECTDLWEATPTFLEAKAPMKKGTSIDTLPKSVWTREKHLTLEAFKPHKGLDMTTNVAKDLEMFRYRNFLQFGPSYEDDFMRYLHISMKPSALSDDTIEATSRWSYIKE